MGDGIPDKDEGDDDGDGISNHLDDDDNDGIPDVLDDDADGNGIPDKDEGDTDGDGIADYLDNDDDNDGIPDSEDDDDDGDGIPDEDEGDDDGDGIPDHLDNDDDNDGIPDSEDDDHHSFRIPDQVEAISIEALGEKPAPSEESQSKSSETTPDTPVASEVTPDTPVASEVTPDTPVASVVTAAKSSPASPTAHTEDAAEVTARKDEDDLAIVDEDSPCLDPREKSCSPFEHRWNKTENPLLVPTSTSSSTPSEIKPTTPSSLVDMFMRIYNLDTLKTGLEADIPLGNEPIEEDNAPLTRKAEDEEEQQPSLEVRNEIGFVGGKSRSTRNESSALPVKQA